MKLSQNDKSLLFSSTNIPDIFFTDYLSEASSDFVKLYLYLLFLSKYDKDVKINDISKTLGIDFPTVQEGLNYWESKGVLIKKTDGYSLIDLQEIELNKIYSPKVTSTPEQAIQSAENQHRAETIEIINSQFFQGVMSPTWYNDIDQWFNKYKFDEQVMIALFNYAFDKKALHRNYIQATADAWAKNNIRNFDDLDEYFGRQEKRSALNNEISKKLNLFRKLTTYEEEDIVKWTENYGYGMDIIEIALKNASSKNKVRFDYIDTLITDWHNKEFTTPEEVNTYLTSLKEKETKKKKIQEFAYQQATFDNLDSLYDN